MNSKYRSLNNIHIIPNRSFLDTKTSKWSFLIKDHNQLMSSIKSLEPDVKIEKLPFYIIKVIIYLNLIHFIILKYLFFSDVSI